MGEGMNHNCHDPTCEYCHIMRKQMSNEIPTLPREFQNDINQAGGFYLYRDLVILENMRVYNGVDVRRLKSRIARQYRRRKKNSLV